MSPQVSQPRRRLPTAAMEACAGVRPQRIDQRGCDAVGVGQQMPAGVLLPISERLENERFLLRAHALQRPNLALAARGLEIVERANAKLLVERCHGFRADALQVQEVQDAGRKFGHELAGDRPGGRLC